MTLIFFIQAVVLGVIEGLTEFLPISSTGHLIIGAHLINANHPNIEVFEIFIQLGAILAIIYEYRVQLLNKTLHLSDKKSKTFFSNIFLAFLPAAIFGLAFHDVIKIFLFNPIVVSCALIIGGILILLIEKKTNIGYLDLTLSSSLELFLEDTNSPFFLERRFGKGLITINLRSKQITLKF